MTEPIVGKLYRVKQVFYTGLVGPVGRNTVVGELLMIVAIEKKDLRVSQTFNWSAGPTTSYDLTIVTAGSVATTHFNDTNFDSCFELVSK